MAKLKRPKDPVSRAVMIGRILVGDIKDEAPDDGKSAAAKSLGAQGGKARARSMTQADRSAAAKKAAKARWKGRKE
jgi:hypothetical protein